MAWYSAWKKWQRLVITVPSGTVTGLSCFPVLVTEASLAAVITDILANGRRFAWSGSYARLVIQLPRSLMGKAMCQLQSVNIQLFMSLMGKSFKSDETA